MSGKFPVFPEETPNNRIVISAPLLWSTRSGEQPEISQSNSWTLRKVRYQITDCDDGGYRTSKDIGGRVEGTINPCIRTAESLNLRYRP
jgi:hypothetical protein